MQINTVSGEKTEYLERSSMVNELEELLKENGVRANQFNAVIALALVGFSLVNVILVACQLIHSNIIIGIATSLLSIFSLLITSIPVIISKGRMRYARELLISGTLISCTLVASYSIYGLWIILAIPIMITCRYYDAVFTRRTAFAAFLCLGIGNLVYVSKGTIDSVQLASFCVDAMLMAITTFFSLSYANHGRENLQSAMELAEQIERRKQDAKRMIEVENKVMISQIQPHFLYNTLSAIMAIEGNPDETIDALEDFSCYLRENLNTLSINGNIRIDKEIEHVKRYVKLEQLRFGNKLSVKYSLKDHNFSLPPLSVQMLAENAIKHGITRKVYGGTLWITTEGTETEHIVRVIDDGIGFDPKEMPEDGKQHIGLENVRLRIRHLCGGNLEINSAPGIGTTCILHIPKEGGHS